MDRSALELGTVADADGVGCQARVRIVAKVGDYVLVEVWRLPDQGNH